MVTAHFGVVGRPAHIKMGSVDDVPGSQLNVVNQATAWQGLNTNKNEPELELLPWVMPPMSQTGNSFTVITHHIHS